nr:basic proline-rich protein-like [Aegilops tauschii subsp. strangulata]
MEPARPATGCPRLLRPPHHLLHQASPAGRAPPPAAPGSAPSVGVLRPGRGSCRYAASGSSPPPGDLAACRLCPQPGDPATCRLRPRPGEPRAPPAALPHLCSGPPPLARLPRGSAGSRAAPFVLGRAGCSSYPAPRDGRLRRVSV